MLDVQVVTLSASILHDIRLLCRGSMWDVQVVTSSASILHDIHFLCRGSMRGLRHHTMYIDSRSIPAVWHHQGKYV